MASDDTQLTHGEETFSASAVAALAKAYQQDTQLLQTRLDDSVTDLEQTLNLMHRSQDLAVEAAEQSEQDHEQEKQRLQAQLTEACFDRDQACEDMYANQAVVIDSAEEVQEEAERFKREAMQMQADAKDEHIAAMGHKDSLIGDMWQQLQSQTKDRNRSNHVCHVFPLGLHFFSAST